MVRRLAAFTLPLFVATCASGPAVIERPSGPAAGAASAPTPGSARKPPAYVLKHGGGFYQDDGPGDNPPDNLDAIPDAVPRAEPLSRAANNPYVALGREYVPMRALKPYHQEGLASWYGRKFHGQKTSSGESYDMYAMTAAHPTLPIPSYARVTNPANGQSVVVRVNDRGPFHPGRIVDLSYTAAWKLGLIGGGSGRVTLDSIVPGETETVAATASGDDPIARLVTATATQEAAPAPLPEVRDGRGTWLQLGAFVSRDNAESMRLHLASQLAALGDKLVVRDQGNVHRVQLGPYRDEGEARRVGEQIRATLAMEPVLVRP